MGLGFFKQNKLDAMRKQAFANGVRRGDGVYDCESCAYARRADCITGVVCTGRVFDDGSYLVVAEVYTCDEFKQGSGI
jgi:hypothetical protein